MNAEIQQAIRLVVLIVLVACVWMLVEMILL
jgi:hypothetical protein